MSEMIREADVLDLYGDLLLENMSAKLRSYVIAIDEPPYSTIYRVPPSTRQVDPSAYEPDVISIGPYHRQNPKLHAMEDHKWRYMHNLLLRRRGRRSGTEYSVDQLLKLCIDKVTKSVARARRCYKVPFDDMSNYDFVMTLVLDGCFILELIMFRTFYGVRSMHDLVYSIHWLRPTIRSDLLKLENQIPFFILQDLFTTIYIVAADQPAAAGSLSLEKLAFEYLISGGPLAGHLELKVKDIITEAGVVMIYHLLHFYHMLLDPTTTTSSTVGSRTDGGRKPSGQYGSSVFLIIKKVKNCLMPHIPRKPSSRLSTDDDDDVDLVMIPCAAELQDAGIQFRIKPKASLLDVTFKDGVLHVPRLPLGISTITLFRNLLALEQFCPNHGRYVTSYAIFLDCIVHTAKDVTILEQCNIIENINCSEDEIALLINRLAKDVSFSRTDNHLKTVFTGVNKYCGSKWHKHRASCMRDYFGNPWSMLSLLAAVALLLMTLIQVVFAILSYGKQ